uniref:sodium-dependent transporter n=1 Tax=Phaeovulum sp. TaxID=2934796 RepID=UPI0035664573
MSDREQWSSQSGFILATIGSAVGLGNIWRFSYVAGENGGGAFLVLYLLYVFVIGLPLVIAELALGRRAQGDAIAAFDGPVPGSRWRYAGVFAGAGAVLILSYYSVIAGWALKYFTGASMGHLWEAASEGYGRYFQSFISQTGEPVIWQGVTVIATALVVAGGVRGGIEALNRFLMPLLALIVIGLAVFAVTLPGAQRGAAFLLTPDWSALVRTEVHAAALGQAFFSLGVGMAVFLTYGSYMPRSF